MNGDAGADQIGRDIRLQIRESQNEIRFELQDFRNVGRDEGRYPRLLAPDLRWAHRVAGNADDPVLLAKQVQCLHRLFGEAHDPAGRELAHQEGMQNNRRGVTESTDQTARSAPGRSSRSIAISRMALSIRRRSRPLTGRITSQYGVNMISE